MAPFNNSSLTVVIILIISIIFMLSTFFSLYEVSTMESPVEEPKYLYKAAESYWKSVEPSVDGMLGGFSNLSSADAHDSRKLLKFLKTKVRKQQRIL